MEEQFKQRFEHHSSHLENPRTHVDQYLQKRKFLWLNKSVKKIERQFQSHKSLIGLKVMDKMRSHASLSPIGDPFLSNQHVGPFEASQLSRGYTSINKSLQYRDRKAKDADRQKQKQLVSLQHEVA